jgi:processive 1,2-diacylglycerol beta-glucosyltransferase
MQNKRVLIISMTCGEGHNAVSKTIKEKLEDFGFEAKIIELFNHSEKRVKFENWQYLFACKYLRVPYSIGWEITNKLDPNKRDKLSVHRTVKKALASLKLEVDEYVPSVVITTHPYSNVAVNDMIKENMINKNIKTVSVLTDYCVHPFWEAGINLDYVITPTEDTVPELLRRGYTEDQIQVIGYPVAKKFLNQIDKAEARAALQLEDKFTVLILSGGNGLGKNLKLIQNILKSKKDFQIVCITGRNKRSKEEIDEYIEKNAITNVKTYGFVNNIEMFMTAADCMFSRGGGVSITEALNVNVPLIIREKMIINEKRNKEFLLKRKSAINMESLSEAKDVIELLIDHPEILEEIRQNQKQTVNPNATNQIAEFINKITS